MTERMAFKGNLNLFEKNWVWIGFEFDKDSLCSIEYQNWYSNPKLNNEVKDFNNSLKSILGLNHKKTYGYPFIDIAISGNDKYISKIDKKNGTLSLTLFPSTPSTETSVINYAISSQIDNTLNNLTKALANYVKTSNTTLKSTYADDVRRDIKFLDEHIDNMSQRQREWYQRLKNIRY